MMSHVHPIDCIDRSLRDIMKVDKAFGGIPIVFGGDPQQILPVVEHGNQPQIVQACIHSSEIWNQIQQIKLTINMRVAQNEIDFSSCLLDLGNGTTVVHPEVEENIIQIPNQYLGCSVHEQINKVFPVIEEHYVDKYFTSKCAILTPVNENVDKLNETIMERFPGGSQSFYELIQLLRKIYTIHIQLTFQTQLLFQECLHIQ